ncbi:hypothetical protein FQN54_004023 [Arachnomyces sp. PD_36]|nr:hypothetical protein FQN54_004023 [Arachnomyces sp. PD_36]
MGDRIDKLSIGKFDQVVALTQQMINAGLQAQYKFAADQGFDRPTNVIYPRYGSQGFYDTVFGASRVIVTYAPGNLSSCTFRMLIKSGKLKVFNSTEGESVTCYDLREFFLACPVNIGLAGVPENSEDYRRIRGLMNKPGDYTIKQLLVDFSTAQTQVLDPAGCDYGVWTADDWILRNIDVPTPPAGAQATNNYWRPTGWVEGGKRTVDGAVSENLKFYFSHALTSVMTNVAAGQLGFTATADDKASTGHEPTFLPTDVRFQTYPYRDTNHESITSIDGNGRLNYILYLEMTDNDPPPNGDDEFLSPNNGNWTNGTDPSRDGIAEFGTWVLSRRKFLDTWFVPRLNKLNRMMNTAFVDPTMSFNANLVLWSTTFNFPLLVGDGCQGFTIKDPKDDGYAMSYSATQPGAVTTMVRDAGVDNLFPSPGTGALCWYHSKTPSNWTKHDTSSWSKCDTYAQSTCCSRLSIVPGSNTMTLEGFTRLRFGYTVDPNFIDSNVYEENKDVVTWKVKFTMTEVSDGGLAIQTSEPEVGYHWQKVVTNWVYSGTGEYYDVKKDVNDVFDQAKKNLGNLVHEFKNALEGNEKFYFPSRGRFFFKDAVFGHNGDLVVKCAYNGDEKGHANPDAPKRNTDNAPPFSPVTKISFGSGGEGSKPDE